MQWNRLVVRSLFRPVYLVVISRFLSLSPRQVTAHGSRRALSARVSRPADDPLVYPNGGTYLHPIAVSLVSTVGSVIYYTTDGTSPDESSSFVRSGRLIVVEGSATLRTIAAYEALSFNSYSSAEVQTDFVVCSIGVPRSNGTVQ